MNAQPTHDHYWVTSLAGTIDRIATLLSSRDFPSGERAALRRMSPGQPPPLAFYRFALGYLPEGWERDRDDWCSIVTGIALMAPSAHQPGIGLGSVLARTGYSEFRLERLLGSRGETRRTLLLRAVRFLASKAASFDWTQAARLLLTRDTDQLEALHRHIATDFYRELENKAG